MNCVHNSYNDNNNNNNNNNNDDDDDDDDDDDINDNKITDFSIALFLLIALNKGIKMFRSYTL